MEACSVVGGELLILRLEDWNLSHNMRASLGEAFMLWSVHHKHYVIFAVEFLYLLPFPLCPCVLGPVYVSESCPPVYIAVKL